MPITLIALLFTNPSPELGLDAFNSSANEISIAYSADFDEAWLERRPGVWGERGHRSRILHSRRDPGTGQWSEPMGVSFADGDRDEGDPFFDAATQTLYFTSDRPHPDLPDSGANIWRVRRAGDQWQAPEPLPAPVNGPGAEYSPVRRGNRLYFASYRDGGGDLYVAESEEKRWTVRKLGPAINAANGEWNLWVSPEEDLILFEASGRATNVTVSGDLYATARDRTGSWLPAIALDALNGPGSDLNAAIVDGRLVYASTSRHSAHADLYATPAELVADSLAAAFGFSLAVANRSSHTLSLVDLHQGRIASTAAIGPGPHLIGSYGSAMAVAAHGVYPRPHSEPVESMPGWVEEAGGTLLFATGATGAMGRTMLRCNRPHGTAWDDRGERLWVSCEDRNGVIEIDFRGAEPGYRLIETNRPGAHVVAWDEERGLLLVAHTAAGGVAFVEPAGEQVRFLPIAPGTEALWIDRERGRAWVTVGPSSALSIVDLERRIELQRLEPPCSFPIDFAQTSDSRLWVACFASSEIIALSLESHAVEDRLALPAGPLNIEAHPTLPVIYASLPRHNRVVEISLTAREITRSFATGMEPDGLAILKAPD